MKDDQRKGEGLRSDDDDDDGLSFLLGLVFFLMVVMMVIISLSSVWVWNRSSSLMGHDDGDGERRGGSNH